MVTGQARRMQEKDARKVAVRGDNGRARWDATWEHNPRIAKPGVDDLSDVQWLENNIGHRPYLDYIKFDRTDKRAPYIYTDWRADPGEIYLSNYERRMSEITRGTVIVEPNIKEKASPNKDWGWMRWLKLADLLRDLPLVQIGRRQTANILPHVEWIPTRSTREAAAMVAGARLLIVPEGGLHHCAAAFGKPAVVIFGGFISPATTGYDVHRNFFTGGRACGMRISCDHCRDAMARITPEEVAAAAHDLLEACEHA